MVSESSRYNNYGELWWVTPAGITMVSITALIYPRHFYISHTMFYRYAYMMYFVQDLNKYISQTIAINL